METSAGHLTYCTNIHAGKNWQEDFENLRTHFPVVKAAIAKEVSMGIGLRLSNKASIDLTDDKTLESFKSWMTENQAYVFTMNGFPYGDFHHTVVKEAVHSPDWTSPERAMYTLRLIDILAKLLPDGMEGGISTSPLSYRHWYKTPEALDKAINRATQNIISVVSYLVHLNRKTGKIIHLDLEPEPDGIIESGREYIYWYEQHLLPQGIPMLVEEFDLAAEEAAALIKKHLCLCYDICHFAIGFEDHETVLKELEAKGLKIGKIQISAALKAQLGTGVSRQQVKDTLQLFDEPTYLHQVVARAAQQQLRRYPDLKQALGEIEDPALNEWRAHFHVPVSGGQFGHLHATQDDILTVLDIQKRRPFTKHMEVETYTWEVLPKGLQIPIAASIIKELQWVLDKGLL
jgi:hypothetical protein